jgi:thymidine kinase
MSIELILGTMYDGKTKELIKRAVELKAKGLRVLACKPSVDTRHIYIKAHNGEELPSTNVSDAWDVFSLFQATVGSAFEAKVMVIDDAQFLDSELSIVAETLARQGIHVVIAGLNANFRGEPWPPIVTLAALADKVTKVSESRCNCCGAPASFPQRIVDGRLAYYNEPLVLVGAEETYEARCRKCFVRPVWKT